MHRTLKLAAGAFGLGLSLALLAPGLPIAQEAKLPRVGFLILGGPGPGFDGVLKGFAQLGYEEGKNIVFEPRFARGQVAKLPELAKELVSMSVDVIVASGAVSASAAKAATAEIPIVMTAAVDPVALGYAASLERPGGNITGITSFDPRQAAEQFKILKDILPKLSHVALLGDEDIPRAEDGRSPSEKAYDDAAKALGITPIWIRLKGPKADLDAAFTIIAKESPGAAVILELPVILSHLTAISERAIKYRVPTMFPAGWPNEGLASYGTSILYTLPRIPVYVDKILKGAKPAYTPIEVVDRRTLVINLKTAKEIGVTIPPELLKRADRVVQ